MEKLKPKEVCCTDPSDRTVEVYWDEDDMAAKVNEIIEWIHVHEKDYKSWRSLIRTIAGDEIRSHNKEKHWKK